MKATRSHGHFVSRSNDPMYSLRLHLCIVLLTRGAYFSGDSPRPELHIETTSLHSKRIIVCYVPSDMQTLARIRIASIAGQKLPFLQVLLTTRMPKFDTKVTDQLLQLQTDSVGTVWNFVTRDRSDVQGLATTPICLEFIALHIHGQNLSTITVPTEKQTIARESRRERRNDTNVHSLQQISCLPSPSHLQMQQSCLKNQAKPEITFDQITNCLESLNGME